MVPTLGRHALSLVLLNRVPTFQLFGKIRSLEPPEILTSTAHKNLKFAANSEGELATPTIRRFVQ